MPNLVFQCLLSGVPESDVLQVIETFYNQGQLDGRVTCKDSISKWRSKAKSEIQRVYSHFNSHHALEAAHIISGDLEWICHNATKDIDRVFLGLHLWVSRASSKDTYFISRPQAMKWTEKWGMTDGLYRGALKRFNKMGLLKVAKNGHRGRPVKGKRLQATEFMLVGDPDRCGRPLGNLDLDSFLGLLCNQLSDSDVRLPDVALAA
jgi:hypothetical protein